MRLRHSLLLASLLSSACVLAVPRGARAAWPPPPIANLPVCTAAGVQVLPGAAPDGANGILLAWIDDRPGAPGVYVQRVSDSGSPLWTPDGVRAGIPVLGAVDPTVGIDNDPRDRRSVVASDGAGGAIVAWMDPAGPGNTDIFAQHIDANGALMWGAAGVPICAAAGLQSKPRIVSDGTGGAIVAWEDHRAGAYQVYAQRITAAGVVQWATDGVLACNAVEDEQYPGWGSLFMAMIPDVGGAILTWSSSRGVIAQRLDLAGNLQWSASGVVVMAHVRTELVVKAATDGNHGAFFAWSDYRFGGSDIYVQRVNASGAVQWTPSGVLVVGSDGFDSWSPEIVADGSGGCIVVWQDTRPYFCGPCNGGWIYAQRMSADGTTQWSAGGVRVSDETRGGGATNMRFYIEMVPDPTGGALFTYTFNAGGGAWPDGPHDIYLQGIRPDGTRRWPNDQPVCTQAANQVLSVIVASGSGAIVGWMDGRGGGWDIYAQGMVNPPVTFTPLTSGLPDLAMGSAAWGDYDNDGDLDVAIMGIVSSPPVNAVTRIYRNDGGTFADVQAGLLGAWYGALVWGDYDSDGDLDLFVSGRSDSGHTARVYRNDGAAGFRNVQVPLAGVEGGAAAWGDYDNDGDLDLLYCGNASSEAGGQAITRLYRYDWWGVFAEIYTGIVGVWSSAIAWADFDNDGDLDVSLAGLAGWTPTARVYRNNGAGPFTDVHANLTPMSAGGIACGDFDSDGDVDLLLAGYPASAVYRNDGGFTFTDVLAGLPMLATGSADWGDYDNDGDLDALVTGQYAQPGATSAIHRNQGGGRFEPIDAGFTGIYTGAGVWGDYDNDGDLDVLLTGAIDFWTLVPFTRLYRSDNAPPNTPPAAPNGPWSVDVNGGLVTLHWSSTTDAATPAAGLSYNLRVGTTSGGGQICPAMANHATGWRRLPRLGNAQKRTSWTFHLPELGAFYWSVQAVDGAFAGSPFSIERYFGPVPVMATLVNIDARTDRIELTWRATGPEAEPANVYRCEDGSAWMNVARVSADGLGNMRYTDTSVRPGHRYGYRLGVRSDDGEVYLGEGWTTVPVHTLALVGLRPNPAGAQPSIAFTLPGPAPARIELLDVNGRRVFSRDVGPLGEGEHVLPIVSPRPLAPGVYLLRLTQSGVTLSRRGVVTR